MLGIGPRLSIDNHRNSYALNVNINHIRCDITSCMIWSLPSVGRGAPRSKAEARGGARGVDGRPKSRRRAIAAQAETTAISGTA